VWVQRPVTVRALADALLTVKAYVLIRDLLEFRVFAKADSVISDEIAAEVAKMHHRKLEILDRTERGGDSR
jgi:hypothetical protein